MAWRIYVVNCPYCGRDQEELTTQLPRQGKLKASCGFCGFSGEFEVNYARSFPQLQFTEVEGWWEHIAEEPIYIRDKEHLLRECEARGLMPKMALDGFDNPLKRGGKRKWAKNKNSNSKQ